MARVVNAKGREIIENIELLRLKAYHGAADRDGVFTIGYGHVITGYEVPDLFRPGQQMKDVAITPDRAEALLVEDMAKAAAGVNMRLDTTMITKLSDDQYSALVAFTFNIGAGNFGISAVRKTINAGDIQSAAEGFRSFIKSNGEVRNGLIRRRAAEKALYLSDYTPMTYFLNNYNSTVIAKPRKYLDIDAE